MGLIELGLIAKRRKEIIALSTYDNTISKLEAETLKTAIDEVSAKQMYIDDDDDPVGYIKFISRDGHLVIQEEVI